MQTTDLMDLPSFEVVVKGESQEITKVYCADLLSWAMGYAPAGCAWCTVMGNVNAVAVAALTDAAVIVLCESAVLDQDAKEKAMAQDICIVRTSLPTFEAGVAISKKANLY